MYGKLQQCKCDNQLLYILISYCNTVTIIFIYELLYILPASLLACWKGRRKETKLIIKKNHIHQDHSKCIKMTFTERLFFFLLLQTLHSALGSNYYNYGGDDGGGDDGGGDDGSYGEYYTSSGATYSEYKGDYTGDDSITYWTEYAILPKKCITYNKKDMIVFSMYEKYYKHCKDSPIGTYMTDVPTFISAWVNQLDTNSEDYGGDDYVTPDTTYVSCYPYETNNGVVSEKVHCNPLTFAASFNNSYSTTDNY